jgi:hypothetical protein
MQRDELDQATDDPIVHHVRSRQVGPTAASRWADHDRDGVGEGA